MYKLVYHKDITSMIIMYCLFKPKFINRQKDREMDTPTSSTILSPVSSASQCLPASPPPTAADLCEFLHASLNNQYFENHFSTLTLSGNLNFY